MATTTRNSVDFFLSLEVVIVVFNCHDAVHRALQRQPGSSVHRPTASFLATQSSRLLLVTKRITTVSSPTMSSTVQHLMSPTWYQTKAQNAYVGITNYYRPLFRSGRCVARKGEFEEEALAIPGTRIYVSSTDISGFKISVGSVC